MKSLIAAFQFLTIFSLSKKNQEMDTALFSRAVRYFPVVGVFLAAVLSILYVPLSFKFSAQAVSLILVMILAVFTKGLHLDGLSDTFDALLSGKSREEMLALMKDHWSGALGTAAVLSIFLLKVFLLAEIPDHSKIPALFLTLTGSRAGMSLILGNFPSARGIEGLGSLFKKEMTQHDWMIAVLTSAIVALITFPWTGLLSLAFGLTCVWLFSCYANSKLGGVTGDVCGAANEIGEVAILFWLKVFLN